MKGLTLTGVAPATNTEFEERFHIAMQDDFNTPEALAVLFDLVRELNKLKNSEQPQAALALGALLQQLGGVLGILQSDPVQFLQQRSAVDASVVEALVAARLAARAAKNWGEADRIRDQLKAMNVAVEDKNGVSTWRVERPEAE